MLKRILLALLLLVTGVLVLAYFFVWRSPKYYTNIADCPEAGKILPMAAYATEHPRPFIVEKPGVVVFGASHTKNPDDPQIKTIEEKWDNLKPTVALIEGRLGFLVEGLMNPVREHGEGGRVNQLARRDGVRAYSWELPKEEQVRRLLTKFKPEQVALFQILLPYFGNLRFGKPASPEDFVSGYLKRGQLPGLENTIATIADVDRIWQRDFPQEKNWRDTSDEYGLPGYLRDLMNESNDIRNRHLACLIKHFTSANERVFAIMGSSHAVCLAKAI